jgi:site-specific recombinase XerD
MNKLKLPKHPHKGMKIYCHRCKRDNPNCNHYEILRFKVKVHVAGGAGEKRTKVLKSTDYNEAVKEAIDFENELKSTNYVRVDIKEEGNDYSILDAVIQYQRYLSGQHRYAHKVKIVSTEYQKECIRYCQFFLDSIKDVKNVLTTRIVKVDQSDVARFYLWAESHYNEKTFNKCMSALRAFYKFLIEVEEIVMKNQFAVYESKTVIKKDILTLTKDEFQTIIDSVGVVEPYHVLGGKGERKNMYRPYLVEGFKLFLLTGGRREEVVELKWGDIYITIEGYRFFKIPNKKVNRIKKTNNYNKYIPINADLFELLMEMGFEKMKSTNEYILFPERNVKTKTIMNDLSKAFSHYIKESGIEKEVSLKNLRKTYISWVNRVMGINTGLLTSHSGQQILKDHYIDSTILTSIEEATLKIKVFGT